MSKESTSWYSERVEQEVQVVRWGAMGTPVLVFPTAGGDAEEVERFLMIDALAELLAQCRIKVYSIESIAARQWLTTHKSLPLAAQRQKAFDAFIYHEVVPAIRADCNDPAAEIVVAGSSIGAYNALAAITRHPDAFSKAICMSGTFNLDKFVNGDTNQDVVDVSPLLFLPRLTEGPHLARLRERHVLLTHGTGRWEEPVQSWRAADALGARGIPNRVDEWGAEWDHDWPTWRRMLPQYLGELP